MYKSCKCFTVQTKILALRIRKYDKRNRYSSFVIQMGLFMIYKYLKTTKNISKNENIKLTFCKKNSLNAFLNHEIWSKEVIVLCE